MFKNQKGITLVALVITIIVLLILAGVTIAMVVGDNGILTRSKQAKFESIKSDVDEKVKMAVEDLSAEIQVQLAKSSDVSIGKDNAVSVITRTCKTGDGFTVTCDKDIASSGKSTISIEYTKNDLKSAATKSWKDNTGKLSYTIEIEGFAVTKAQGSGNNYGGYSTGDAAYNL